MITKLPLPEGKKGQNNDCDYMKIVNREYRHNTAYKLTKSKMLEFYFPEIGYVQPAWKIHIEFGWNDCELFSIAKRKRETNPHGKGKWDGYLVTAWTPTGKKLYARVSKETFLNASRRGRQPKPFVLPFDYEFNVAYSDAYATK